MKPIDNKTPQPDSKETLFVLKRKRDVHLEIVERCKSYLENHQTWKNGQKKELMTITGDLSFAVVTAKLKESTASAEALFKKYQAKQKEQSS